MKYLASVILFLNSFTLGQGKVIYWNSMSTSVKVDVPISSDESLEGGRIQIRVSFDGENYFDLGEAYPIMDKDLEELKEILVPRNDFISAEGYKEGAKARFIAEIWDRAGNSVISTVSDSILTIDETIPILTRVSVNSTNSQKNNLAIPDDMFVLEIEASEPILPPKVEVNGDDLEAVGEGNSWKVERVFDNGDDGPITFSVNFEDYARNLGETVVSTTNNSKVIFDGTEPALNNVTLFSNNPYDESLAVKGDSVFLEFVASESLFIVTVKINGNEISQLDESNLKYKYSQILTDKDTEGVIPFMIDYNDLAGNAGEQVVETSDDSQVLFDMTPPKIFKIESVGPSTKIIKGSAPIGNSKQENSKTSSDSSGLFSGNVLIIMIVLSLIFVLIITASWWKLFSKASQSGWKVLIPFFNLFILTKILKKPLWWVVIYLILPLGHILVSLQIAKLFGKKIIFAIGMIFLPIIFYPILAFGKSEIAQ